MTTTPKPHHIAYRHFRYYLLFVLILVLTLSANLPTAPMVQASPQLQSTSTPQATPTFDVQRLAKPSISDDHSEQLQKGSILYFGFECPCHSSRYDPAGRVIKGPASLDLKKLRVIETEDGNLHVFTTSL